MAQYTGPKIEAGASYPTTWSLSQADAVTKLFELLLDVADLAASGGGGGVSPTRAINTTAPLSGGGDLSADRTLSLLDDGVTFAKIQNIATDRLIGRDTAASGDPEEIAVGGGLEFTGSASIQRSALTGDVTASAGSNTTAIANDAVTYAKMQNVSAASKLLGRGSAGGAGDPEEITLGTNLSMSGSTLNATGGGGSGDVIGPASATDNALARFDTTTGKLLQDSKVTADDDGVIRSTINTGANPVSVPLCNWLMQTADYTLTSSVAEQKAFNQTTNGRLTLPTGVYEFECFLYLTTMSATSGNLAFDPVGAGTAVTDRWGQTCYGLDSSTPLVVGARGGSASVTQQTPASAITAATGTGLVAKFSGMFRISTGGTIIPSVTLVTAAAAIVKAGSWFKIKKIGESSETFVGAWT